MNTCRVTFRTGTRTVTVILDLTPIQDRRGPSRLLDMIPGRSKNVFQTWLASQPHTRRENIEVDVMDGFTGFMSAAAEEVPARGRSLIPSTSCTSPVMFSMSAAGVSGKNLIIGAGAPRIPCTRSVGCYIPGHACSRHISNTRYSTCSPAIASLLLRSPGVSSRTSSMPAARPTQEGAGP